MLSLWLSEPELRGLSMLHLAVVTAIAAAVAVCWLVQTRERCLGQHSKVGSVYLVGSVWMVPSIAGSCSAMAVGQHFGFQDLDQHLEHVDQLGETADLQKYLETVEQQGLEGAGVAVLVVVPQPVLAFPEVVHQLVPDFVAQENVPCVGPVETAGLMLAAKKMDAVVVDIVVDRTQTDVVAAAAAAAVAEMAAGVVA